MIYNVFLFQDYFTSSTFRYADVIAVIKVDSTARETVAAVQEELYSIINQEN